MTTNITPFLWFDHQAEEAAELYTSVFRHSKITAVVRYGDEGPGPKGSAMTVAFELDGKEFTALNGGPHYTFTPAISFVVHCNTQQEVDHYWDKLSDGGRTDRCGWLQDRYGVSWQIVPRVLLELLQDKDAAKAARVTHAMLQMTRLDIEGLTRAALPG